MYNQNLYPCLQTTWICNTDYINDISMCAMGRRHFSVAMVISEYTLEFHHLIMHRHTLYPRGNTDCTNWFTGMEKLCIRWVIPHYDALTGNTCLLVIRYFYSPRTLFVSLLCIHLQLICVYTITCTWKYLYVELHVICSPSTVFVNWTIKSFILMTTIAFYF